MPSATQTATPSSSPTPSPTMSPTRSHSNTCVSDISIRINEFVVIITNLGSSGSNFEIRWPSGRSFTGKIVYLGPLQDSTEFNGWLLCFPKEEQIETNSGTFDISGLLQVAIGEPRFDKIYSPFVIRVPVVHGRWNIGQFQSQSSPLQHCRSYYIWNYIQCYRFDNGDRPWNFISYIPSYFQEILTGERTLLTLVEITTASILYSVTHVVWICMPSRLRVLSRLEPWLLEPTETCTTLWTSNRSLPIRHSGLSIRDLSLLRSFRQCTIRNGMFEMKRILVSVVDFEIIWESQGMITR